MWEDKKLLCFISLSEIGLYQMSFANCDLKVTWNSICGQISANLLPLEELDVLNFLGMAPAVLFIPLCIPMRETSELDCCAGSSSTVSFSSLVELADCGVCDDGACGGSYSNFCPFLLGSK